MNSDSRSFTVVSCSGSKVKEGGRYISKSPSSAARKAFRRLCKDHKKSKACRMSFEIQETTRGSKGKVFSYVGSRKKLSCPLIVERDGKSIAIKYEISVKAN